MNNDKIRYYVGNENIDIKPRQVYDELVCAFLEDLSKSLMKSKMAKQYPDVLTFAFWCRKANIMKLKSEYINNGYRVGRGLAFHIAPSNVPINFAFSLVFGLLSGNSNIVRVSEKAFPQIQIVCDEINNLLQLDEYSELSNQIQVVSYGHNEEINDYFSRVCDVRIIWGGDNTINTIRQYRVKPRCVEIAFADRYSLAIIDEQSIENISDKELQQLSQQFYNDTYLMDQNACSSPHLIIWNKSNSESGRRKFWQALENTAQKYDLTDKKVIDKYTFICEQINKYEEIDKLDKYSNTLYVAHLSRLTENMTDLRGIFGLFMETEIDGLEELNNIADIQNVITSKVQTCVTYGVDNKELLDLIMNNHIGGIDRIVNIGEAMNIGVYWDGYDVIGIMSRNIAVM